nr:UDP-glycosyltransferase 73E1-like [Tanacetum cinerariifolium]
MQEAKKTSFGIVVNRFEEMEPKYVKAFKKAKDKTVWCIGPVSLCNKSLQDISERGNKAMINGHDCVKWLDSREPGSVVYVCLGSLSHASTEQAIELGLGLKLSNTPFIWFIRHTSHEFEQWISEEGYEERIKGRGLMIRGRAPQILILSHQAIRLRAESTTPAHTKLGYPWCFYIFIEREVDFKSKEDSLKFDIGGHTLELGRIKFSLLTGFSIGKVIFPKVTSGDIPPLVRRLFPEKVLGKYKRPKEHVFMGRETNHVMGKPIMMLAENLTAWDNFP